MKIGDIVVIVNNTNDMSRGDIGLVIDNGERPLVWVYNVGEARELPYGSFIPKEHFEMYEKEVNDVLERIEKQLQEETPITEGEEIHE